MTSLLLLCSLSYSQSADTTYYPVIKGGAISGEQKSWKTGQNEFRYTYHYNDRGRGDSLSAVVRTNEDGLIIYLSAEGVDYYKNPYSESFEIVNDSAVWTINGERKSKKFEDQLYNTYIIPGIIELQVNWLRRQPGMKGNILPEGVLHIDEPLIKNISYEGKSANLKLQAVYFDTIPAPYYVWLTEDNLFFAQASSWFSIMHKGYESWADTLFTMQELADRNIYTKQMRDYSSDLSEHILITHANIFQSSTASVQNDMSVEVKNGFITDIYSSSDNKNTNADTIIDASGKFLMPGLWDMHSHYDKSEGVPYIAGGVTHVRDMGNSKIILTYREQIADNKMLGPDLSFISGFIDKKGPLQGPTGKIVDSFDEALKGIDEFKNLGYNQIKLYSSVLPEWVAPLTEHSHSLGMRVCGHIPAFMTAAEAIEDGYDEITHMNFIFLNFLGDTIDTRTPLRLRAVGDYGGKIDLQSEEVHSFISLMKKKSVSLDATLNTFAQLFIEFKGDTIGYLKPIASWLPDYMLANITVQAPFGNDDQRQDYINSFNNLMKMEKMLFDNGILLVAGTDGGNAPALHHELELYVQAGIPSNEVLKIATYNAALDCNLQDKYGEIKTGRLADFILIDGNPVENISDIRHVEWVIKNRKIYSPKELLASQGWKYYY